MLDAALPGDVAHVAVPNLIVKAFLPLAVACALSWRPALGAEVARDTGQLLVAPPGHSLVHRLPAADFEPTAAYRWLDVLLAASGRDAQRHSPRPTVLSRTIRVDNEEGLVLGRKIAMHSWPRYETYSDGTARD